MGIMVSLGVILGAFLFAILVGKFLALGDIDV